MCKKVIHMVTLPQSIHLMDGQFQYFSKKGYKMGIISSPGPELIKVNADLKQGIYMSRTINPFKDIMSLYRLIKYFIKIKPDIVNAGTPKASFLGILASFITRVPNRIYTMRGLRLETEKGLKRLILWVTEKLTCLLATQVICISPSLLEEARNLKLLRTKGIVIGRGSSNGIQLKKYPKRKDMESEINYLKEKLGINENDFVLGYVGRLTKDKGIEELLLSFKKLQSNFSNVKLLILGRFEGSKGLSIDVEHEINNNKNIIYLGFVQNLEKYYYLMDVLIFPTYREGFGNVSIQAQAAGVPVITTNATGAKDTVIDQVTGFIVPVKNVNAIVKKITILINNKELKLKLGKSARKYVFNNFNPKIIWEGIEKLYQKGNK